jgi:inosine-uridine nucleoside N-ribohydrolase
LKVLEIAGSEIPVFRGAARPLVHEKSEFAMKTHGGWWSDEPAPVPLGGFAKKKAESRTAVEFMISTVMQNPGQITILAIGPLTNIAMAMRLEPAFARNVKQLVIMGGAIASLPDGGGNQTPNAEFNFWVDPEAARIVLRSGIPTILSPLNVSRKSKFSKQWYDKIVAVDTPITKLVKERLAGSFQDNPERVALMYDQIATATLVDESLCKTTELYVDVDDKHDVNYGVSVGGKQPWPGAEGAQKIAVQYDLDWERFIRLYVERVTRKESR